MTPPRRAVSSRLQRTVTVAALVLGLALPGPAGPAAAVPRAPQATAAAALPVTRPASAVPLAARQPAWVDVSVATLWRSPASPRSVDRPALARPARIVQWLRTMTTAERRALGGRADTQALLGDRVRVLRLRPGWARVVLPSQLSQHHPSGYPGWVPRRQLTATPPTRSARLATVTRRTAWLRGDRPGGRTLLRISFGTRLPVVGRTPRMIRVAMPDGTVRRIGRPAVALHRRSEPAVDPGRDSLVRTATSFTGLPYLWSGVSGFGLDCSGLTWLTYRVHGVQTPRDALPQSQSGTPVRSPRRGDLMFYATDGLVHHVSMYVGDGRMVHSPGTGQAVEVIPTSTPAYRAEYSGARRFLP